MVDYEKVDKLVENCKKLYPDIPDYCLWVLACDYYINEEKDEEELALLRSARLAMNEEGVALSSPLCARSCSWGLSPSTGVVPRPGKQHPPGCTHQAYPVRALSLPGRSAHGR